MKGRISIYYNWFQLNLFSLSFPWKREEKMIVSRSLHLKHNFYYYCKHIQNVQIKLNRPHGRQCKTSECWIMSGGMQVEQFNLGISNDKPSILWRISRMLARANKDSPTIFPRSYNSHERKRGRSWINLNFACEK